MDQGNGLSDGEGLTRARAEARADADATPASRDDSAAARDAAADVRDADADDRDHVWEANDEAQGRPAFTRVSYRSSARGDRESSADDRRAAALDRATSAEALAQAAEQIESLMHDHLTGFYQTGAGWIELERQVARCHRTGEPLTIGFVDIDGLKLVNDEEGHEAGNRLIRHVSDAIKSVLRGYDVVVRYGGDEFVCGMQGMTESQALERCASMQARLDEAGQGTASVGVAQLQPTDTLPDVVSRADRAMYAAKAQRHADL